MEKDIVELFTKACEINSPSGYEKDMSDWILKQFKPTWKVWKDDFGKCNNSNTGNVYCLLEVDKNAETLVFCAHMDTVSGKKDKIKVGFDGVNFKSLSNTILGADNKAGLLSLILFSEAIKLGELKYNILLFFPTREEKGIMGSSNFTFPGKVKYVVNVDESMPVGYFVNKALGYINFRIVVNGVSAHASKSYEKGKNAILIASKLIQKLPLGKNIKEGWTLNIGKITGGENTNLVCDQVELSGEVRAFRRSILNKKLSELSKINREVSNNFGIKISLEISKESYIPPFMGACTNEISKICKSACKNLNLKLAFNTSFSTSDANSFSGMGYQILNMARGGENAHSKKEFIKLIDIKRTTMLLKEIVRLS